MREVNEGPAQVGLQAAVLWGATAGFAEEEHDCHTFKRIILATVLRTEDRGEALTQGNSQWEAICD